MKCSIFLQVQGKSFSLLYVDCDVTNFAIEETWNIRASLDKITCHVNLVVVIVDIGYRKFFGFCLTLLDYLKYVFGDETEFRVSFISWNCYQLLIGGSSFSVALFLFLVIVSFFKALPKASDILIFSMLFTF